MDEKEWMAERFEGNRPHLRAVAFRVLGSLSEADDAVQETWLRLSRSDTGAVKNLTGWLTTVTSRICLDILRARRAHREAPLETEIIDGAQAKGQGNDPEQEALLSDSVGLALLVILDTLDPAERLAFVLHDMFGVPFDEIARIAERSPAAARQLASRARRRVRIGKPIAQNAGRTRRREIVEAFYAAARGGDFERLLALLDPAVVLKADSEATPSRAAIEIRGAEIVAKSALAGNRAFAETALVDKKPGIIVARGGQMQLALLFKIGNGMITEINIVGNRERLGRLEIKPLRD